MKATKIHSKVAGGTIGAATSTILIWAVEAGANVPLPTRVEDAVTVLCVFALGWLASE